MGQNEDGELVKGLTKTTLEVNGILDKSRLGRVGDEKSETEGGLRAKGRREIEDSEYKQVFEV